MEIKKTDQLLKIVDKTAQANAQVKTVKGTSVNPLSQLDLNIVPKKDVKTEEVFAQKVLPESQAYKKATEKLISYFKNEFMKTEQFKDTFGDLEWEDISQEVTDSINIVRDRKFEKENYNDKAFVFTGRIYDLYTEVVIDKAKGNPKKIYVEID